jgi:hypothetical protein
MKIAYARANFHEAKSLADWCFRPLGGIKSTSKGHPDYHYKGGKAPQELPNAVEPNTPNASSSLLAERSKSPRPRLFVKTTTNNDGFFGERRFGAFNFSAISTTKYNI